MISCDRCTKRLSATDFYCVGDDDVLCPACMDGFEAGKRKIQEELRETERERKDAWLREYMRNKRSQ